MVVACVLPWLLPLSVGIAVLTLSELVVVPVYMRALGFSWFEALMQAVLYVGFAGFVFVTSMVARQQAQARDEQRSEEHTSELQSLMRISYAVFCLKKKNTIHKSTCNHSDNS